MNRKMNGLAPRYIYAGSYTSPHFAPGAPNPSQGTGISVYKMLDTGELELASEVATENPSSLAINSDKTFLYAANELGVDEDANPLGSVTAFAVDAETGGLSVLNQRPTQGGWPCHCSVHLSGRFLIAANYGTGDYPVFPIASDGRLGTATFIAKGEGSGPDTARQSGPHAHMVLSDPQSNRVYGVDLGADRVWSWDFDENSGRLTASKLPFVQTASGCGPRHMVFSDDGCNAFVLNELSSTVDLFDVDPETGFFIWRQTVSTLPEDCTLKRPVFDPENPGFIPEGTNTGAEIRLHPSGKWLYTTNRGMNTVAQFAVDADSRELRLVDVTDSKGDCPRGMIIDPEGHVLIVGNQNTNTIAVFAIDAQTGQLGNPIQVLDAPTPVDFVFGAKVAPTP
ncbi:lactonase family protein [Shimia thalassica]|uniref:lactonase family protein n=1 Tax=Shimia thalassica TaxID=1715693 RepID=UPI002733D579|nr:lactonase family protein [Shimia thalassica]MDP2496221.1 lactonase family protein [Shimia thalassica]